MGSKIKDVGGLAVAYRRLDRKGKGRMLDALCGAMGCHRKHLITALGGAGSVRADTAVGAARPRKRRPHYAEAELRRVFVLWRISGGLSAERFKAQLPLLLEHAARHVRGWTEDTAAVAGAISARQLTRRMAPMKKRHRLQANSATRRSRLIRHMVEVSTMRPLDAPPGLLECDLVAHGGGSGGTFIWTVNATDVASGWTVAEPILGAAAAQVVPALKRLFRRVPFAVYELHTDNGSEFLNGHLLRECRRLGIEMTRGRPNRKNDNARIEQRNSSHVRQVVGYARHDTAAEREQLAAIYAALETLTNLFEPSSRLTAKRREGARLHRVYDTPQTPLDRLLQSRPDGDPLPPPLARWQRMRRQLDPIPLYEQLGRRVEKLHALRRRRAA